MANYYVVEVIAAEPDSPVQPGNVVAEFEQEEEALYFLSVAGQLRSLRRCTLGVKRQRSLPQPTWMAKAA